jgi:hypothetical protein
MRKAIAAAVVSLSVAGIATASGLAALPGAAQNNPNANPNACWGQDRSFYASEKFFGANMDIKQSFPGDVGVQRAAWVATYCDPHGPAE